MGHAMEYVQTPVQVSKKSDLMVISAMKSSKIIWYLMRRHRVGLLITLVHILVGYIAYDKILYLFFK